MNSRAAVQPNRYVRASYSPSFDEAHRQSLPDMSAAFLASGQNSAVAELLTTMGGSGFVLDATATKLIATGGFKAVTDVEMISQPVYAVMHQRHRTSWMHRRLTRIVARRIGS